MTEYPIFIAHGGERIAAIVTVPDDEPTSLVLLAQGLGAPRSHRYGLWCRTARQLIEHRIASVRFDYPQLGDSTGIFAADLKTPPAAALSEVVNVTRDVLGIQHYGIVGNCIGLLAAFEIAKRDSACVSVACVITDPPKVILVDRSTPAYQQRAKQLSRKVPKLRRIARRHFHVRKGSLRHGLIPEVEEVLQSTDMLFLLTGSEETGRRLGANVARLQSGLGKRAGHRAEVRTIAAQGTDQFVLPLTTHPQVVEALTQWMSQTLPHAEPAKKAS
jgi:hypothetical protein